MVLHPISKTDPKSLKTNTYMIPKKKATNIGGLRGARDDRPGSNRMETYTIPKKIHGGSSHGGSSHGGSSHGGSIHGGSIHGGSRESSPEGRTTREAPLFVSSPGDYLFPGDIVVDHPIFDGVRGHFQPNHFEKFYTDEMHEKVVELLSSTDTEFDARGARISRGYMRDDDIEEVKHATLMEFFRSKCIGYRSPQTGDIFRGTIMMMPLC